MLHDFYIGQPKGGGVLHNDVALFVESKFTFWGIIGARLDLGIWVGIGENERVDFLTAIVAFKIFVRKDLVQFLLGQFDDLIIRVIVNITHFDFWTHWVKPPL